MHFFFYSKRLDIDKESQKKKKFKVTNTKQTSGLGDIDIFLLT